MQKKAPKSTMKKIEIPVERITTPEELHEYLQDTFSFPDYYGMNLDALYDCLGEVAEKTQIIVSNSITDEENLGEYGERFLAVLEAAAQDNEFIQLKITE